MIIENNIKNSHNLIPDSWTCLDVNYLVPKESQTCTLIFNLSPQDTAIVPNLILILVNP